MINEEAEESFSSVLKKVIIPFSEFFQRKEENNFNKEGFKEILKSEFF